MFKVGERVVYGQNGVMTVRDIREEDFLGDVRKYYVLHAEGDGNSAFTFVPCDNEKLTAQMRPLMTEKEATLLVEKAKSAPRIEWVEDSRARGNAFKKILEAGDYLDMLRMIYTIEEKLSERKDIGKRSYISDEVIMKKAKKLVFSEIDAVLGEEYVAGK